MLSNWRNFKVPFAPLDTFTRHEPFPSEELKATYVDRQRGAKTRKPKKTDRTLLAQVLERRWSDGHRR